MALANLCRYVMSTSIRYVTCDLQRVSNPCTRTLDLHIHVVILSHVKRKSIKSPFHYERPGTMSAMSELDIEFQLA